MRAPDMRVPNMRDPGPTPRDPDLLVPRASDMALIRQAQRRERVFGMPRAVGGRAAGERPSWSHRLRMALGPRVDPSARPSRVARTIMALSLAVPMSAGMATFTPLAAQDQGARQGSAQAETAAGPISGSKPDKGSAQVSDLRAGSHRLIIEPDALTLALGDKETLSAWICAVGDGPPRGLDEEPGTDDDTCTPARATTWSVRDAGAASLAPDHGKKVRLSADAVIAQTVITAELGELRATATLAIDDVASAKEPAKPAKKAAASKSQGKKAEAPSRRKEPAKRTAAPSQPATQAPLKRSTKEPPSAVEQAETQRAEQANVHGASTRDPSRQAAKETPSPAVATEPFIVTFESGTGTARQRGIVERAGGVPGRALGRADMRKVSLPGSSRAKALAALRDDPSVRSVDPDYQRAVNADPSDSDFGQQWNLSGDRADIRWDEVWDGKGSHPIVHTATIAILDTGVDSSHPDLDGVVDLASSDPNGHGTWMAGIAAAETDNDVGVAGVAYGGVRIRPITVIGADGYGYDSDIIAGIGQAIDTGADVILMAFSGRNRSAALQDAVDAALDAGIVVVASVGNEASTAASYPAGYPGVIGVAASRKDPLIAVFSDRGPSAYVAAPGVDIPTLAPGGKTTNIRGTSAAAAEVAGAAALLLATGAAPSDIARRLSTTAQPTDVDGLGILDLAQALGGGGGAGAEPSGDMSGPAGATSYVAEPTPTPTPTPTPAPTPTPTPWPTPAGIQGLDVSHWNDVPDFGYLKQLGTRFVFSKATQGTSFIDWTYPQHTADARAAGVHTGAYHFFDYRLDGTKQARHFLATVRGTSGLTRLLPLVIDVEYLQTLGTPNKAAARVRLRDMVNEIYRQTGRYPMIYTSQNMWERVVGAPADFGDHPLWVACWKCDRIYMPRGWTKWTFWQFGQIKFDGGPNLDGNVYSSGMRALTLERQRPMRLAQGATWTNSRTVQADLIGFDGKEVRHAVGDQAFGAWKPYQRRYSLQLGPRQGEQDVRIQLRNSKNVKSPILRDDIRLDTKRPSLSGPRITIRGGARMERSATRVPIRAKIKAKDARSGLDSVALRASCAGTERASRRGPGPMLATETRLNRSGCTIVGVGKDVAGNSARKELRPRFSVIDLRAGEDGVRFSGKWKVARAKAALGRTLARTSVRGAQARVAFRGEQFAVVVRRGPSGGRLAVIVDGKRVDTIDLYAVKADQRRITYVRSVGRGRHVLKLRATGTGDARSTGSTVWLDSVLVLDRRR